MAGPRTPARVTSAFELQALGADESEATKCNLAATRCSPVASKRTGPAPAVAPSAAA